MNTLVLGQLIIDYGFVNSYTFTYFVTVHHINFHPAKITTFNIIQPVITISLCHLTDNSCTAPTLWTSEATLLLMTSYEELKEKFGDARVKKKDVWEDIAGSMQKLGYGYTGTDCSKKWSNLEIRYE